MLVRALRGLESIVPVHITGGPKKEGYPANWGEQWVVPGTEHAIHHLHELYVLNEPNYTGRVTIPVLWDQRDQTIVSNESSEIMTALESMPSLGRSPDMDFQPASMRTDLSALNEKLYHHLSNGVYRSGFAANQTAYEEAVESVFRTLAWLDMRLSKRRFLMGDWLTEADWRLLPTLVRFDIDYVQHSRCGYRRLVDYPNLWAYARELYQWPGVSETVRFDQIHASNYYGEPVIPRAPSLDWEADPNRQHLGPIRLAIRRGGSVAFDRVNEVSGQPVVAS
ncbi:glutathione-dependent reductase [Saccharospirillum salsuginis]|uniref:Glutathione-dependent reductase n=2 Tax=Saccharospirillum salsuginis TaxID=418750 RepID=A0A918KM15_9GAMM|nr:glutathione-dependent reductase [Saccharospirillum salsuginis]